MGKHGIVRTVALTTGMTQIVGPSETRVSLLLSPPPTASTVTVTTDASASGGNGLILTQSAGFLLITADAYGDAVKKAWYGAATPSATLGFLETVED